MSGLNFIKRIRENEKKINDLEKKFKSYKRWNDKMIKSYNEQFNTLFLFTDIKPKDHLKANHELNLELLKFVDNICKKYGLEFWLDYGSMLGAIRHKGFIPWDDDVDIAMMRKDYNKFFEVLPQELKDNNLDETLSVTFNISDKKPVPCIQILYNQNVPGLLAGIDISAYDFVEEKIDVETFKEIQDIVREKNKDGIPSNAVSVVDEGIEVFMPFEDLVDLAQEKERLEGEKKKLQAEVERASKMLSNPGFVNKAPEAKINEEKAKLAKYQEMLDSVIERLSNI